MVSRLGLTLAPAPQFAVAAARGVHSVQLTPSQCHQAEAELLLTEQPLLIFKCILGSLQQVPRRIKKRVLSSYEHPCSDSLRAEIIAFVSLKQGHLKSLSGRQLNPKLSQYCYNGPMRCPVMHKPGPLDTEHQTSTDDDNLRVQKTP